MLAIAVGIAIVKQKTIVKQNLFSRFISIMVSSISFKFIFIYVISNRHIYITIL